MISRKISAIRELAEALPKDELQKRATLPIFQELQGTVQTVHEAVKEQVQETVQEIIGGEWIKMPFLHDEIPDIRAKWNLANFNPDAPNDAPNMEIAIMALILATNIEFTVGKHAWSLTESSLNTLGFTNIMHFYFERAQKINHPAMVFGRSTETVNGKYVVAAIYRGSSSLVDFISDVKAEPGGFNDAGINATNELRAYCKLQNLTKENTILFITGHSYGAACASLVGINSTDLAERNAIFCYPFATPNYIRNGLTGDGMKMFSFDSNEDVVPQVPVGPGLDKTGGQIKFDRLDLKLNHPEQYARFSKLYEHFRDCDFDSDKDFLPDAYTFKPYVKRPVDNVIIRNHMPYTYMPLLLCSLSDEAVNAHIVEVPRKTAEDQMPDWDMFVGEVYKLPLTKTGMFTWKSSDKTVAAVDEKGMLCAKKPGDAVLTITTPTGNKSGINIHVTSV